MVRALSTVVRSASSASSPTMARLVWRAGTLEQSFPVTGSHRIGRHPANDLQLLDSIASKAHCQLELRGSECRLRDLQSLNGTYVNGQRVMGECRLRHGDQLTIGSTQLRFEQPQAPVPAGVLQSSERRFVSAVGGLLEAANVEAAFTGALRVAIDLLGADWGALILLEPAGMPRLSAITLLAGTSPPPRQLEFDVALVGQALMNRTVVHSVQPSGDAYRGWKPRTLVAVPLVSRDRAFGVLWLERAALLEGNNWVELEHLGRLAALVAEALLCSAQRAAAGRPD